jgi:RNA polymerase sigma-70 factor (ECF subfamily)
MTNRRRPVYSARVMDPSDAVLVERCLAGNTGAYNDLILRYQDAVFGFVLKMTGNWHEAADLTQDTFLRAYRKLDFYDPRFAFGKWLISIAANLTKNRFRSFFRRRRMEQELAARLDNPIQSPTVNPGVEELHQVLRQIPEKLRAPLVLKHVEGYSYQEIARTLGISVSAAKMRVARARDKIVQRLRRPDAGSEP